MIDYPAHYDDMSEEPQGTTNDDSLISTLEGFDAWEREALDNDEFQRRVKAMFAAARGAGEQGRREAA